MQFKLLGHNGCKVSNICLGCLKFGTSVTPTASAQLLNRFFDLGGNFFDTANNYVNWKDAGIGGESEAVIGNWIKSRGNRDRVFLGTKVGFKTRNSFDGLKFKNIITECELSLKRLNTDYIDFYFAHFDDRCTPFEEILSAFDRLITDGKIINTGACNITAWRLEQARTISKLMGYQEYCCVQKRFSLFKEQNIVNDEYHKEISNEILDYCRSEGLTLLAYSPLRKGGYSNIEKPLPIMSTNHEKNKLYELYNLALENNVTPNQIVLAWMMQQTKVPVIPIMGVSNIHQLDENLRACNLMLRNTVIDYLNRLAEI